MRMVFNRKSYSIDPQRAKYCRDTVNREIESVKSFCDSHDDTTLFVTYLIIKDFMTKQLLNSLDDKTVRRYLKEIRENGDVEE